jgi:predicted enzyme related to lactoylglutathione lyase
VGATVQAYLDRRGEGPYLTCFAVGDVHAAYERLGAAGISVVGPPQTPPAKPGFACDVLWLKPRETASAFMQLLSFSAPLRPSPDWATDRRLFTHVITTDDLAATLEQFARLGLRAWARYQTEVWGLQTAVIRLPDATNLEIVCPRDTTKPASAALAATMARRGGHGHYMTVFDVPDVDALADRFDRDGVATLGAPVAAPPESPWGPCRQLWVHPRLTHGAFIEFLTLPPGSDAALNAVA